MKRTVRRSTVVGLLAIADPGRHAVEHEIQSLAAFGILGKGDLETLLTEHLLVRVEGLGHAVREGQHALSHV